ncbi:winged helix-turn-helix transcriptional regulator [Weissella soli]|uniref:HxlR family transcriptional regulator n=1 Tax=Weissella soli TaxID=155866 RepID=A0A288QMK8_9LACO|nr:helix-turn-helix domain-containing protein [Weissella soli]AOT56396.1 HTH-type transcriptional activator HxlR [Weissella soli]MCT8395008.1 transcriptional regulator [Weissella soli]NKY82848.1 helix-turn-helix transcriptional regulator [Weissella soli]RDL11965.1 HxlR family transcriptional regulator [Weissella soli]GEN92805.1 transcriptional regulator [Weissella soli]
MTDSFRNNVINKLQNGDFDCTKEFTVSMFSGKHKLMILWILIQEGPQSFSYFMNNLKGISKKVLSNQLNELMDDHLIDKSEYMVGRVKHTQYSMSEIGNTLVPIINSLNAWGEMRLNSVDIEKKFNR